MKRYDSAPVRRPIKRDRFEKITSMLTAYPGNDQPGTPRMSFA